MWVRNEHLKCAQINMKLILRHFVLQSTRGYAYACARACVRTGAFRRQVGEVSPVATMQPHAAPLRIEHRDVACPRTRPERLPA